MILSQSPFTLHSSIGIIIAVLWPYSILMFKLNKNKVASSTATPQGLYDPFIFVDSLTNRSIAVKEINCRPYQMAKDKHKQRSVRSSEQIQMKELDNCLNFLKSTMAFRMKVLRHKLYKESKKEGSIQKEEENLIKKRLIRKIIQQQIETKNRNQFTTYLKCPDKHPSINLLSVATHDTFAINKKTITDIVNTMENKGRVTANHSRHATEQKKDDPYLLKLTYLQEQIQKQVQQKLRKAGQYLVEPNNDRLKPSKTCRSNLSSQRHNSKTRNQHFNDLKWIPTNVCGHTIKDINTNIKRRQRDFSKQQSEMMRLVATATVEDVQIYANKCRKEVIKVRDREGNNLMHIAALNNKSSIFEWLLSVLGIESLLQKNDFGETPINLSLKLDHRQILNLIPQSFI